MLYAEDIVEISDLFKSFSQGRFYLEPPLRAKLEYLFSLLNMTFDAKQSSSYWAQFPTKSFGFEWMHVQIRVSSTYKDIDICICEECLAMINTDFADAPPKELYELIDALILATKRALAYVQIGKYDEVLAKSVPYEMRYGQLPISIYWGIYPEKKKHFFSNITSAKLQEFQDPTSTFETFDKCPKTISVWDYLRWLKAFYVGMGLPVVQMSALQAYEQYGVMCMDIVQAAQSTEKFFEEFYSGTSCVFDDGESEIFIYPLVARIIGTQDVAYLIGVSGDVSFEMTPRFVSGYISMRRAGAPATLESANKYRRRLLGLGNVGIVPEYKIPDMCSSQDKKFSDVDFCMNLSDFSSNDIIPYVQWLALEKPPVTRLGS